MLLGFNLFQWSTPIVSEDFRQSHFTSLMISIPTRSTWNISSSPPTGEERPNSDRISEFVFYAIVTRPTIKPFISLFVCAFFETCGLFPQHTSFDQCFPLLWGSTEGSIEENLIFRVVTPFRGMTVCPECGEEKGTHVYDHLFSVHNYSRDDIEVLKMKKRKLKSAASVSGFECNHCGSMHLSRGALATHKSKQHRRKDESAEGSAVSTNTVHKERVRKQLALLASCHRHMVV